MHKDAKRARKLAESVQLRYAELGPGQRARAAEVAAWLARQKG